MRNENMFFTVFPSVVKAGEKTEITITAIHEKMPFTEDTYIVRVVPKEKRDVPRNSKLGILSNEFKEFTAKVKDNTITISYLFRTEQEYRLILFTKERKRMYDFAVYALNEDLYGTMAYRGDLHMHTTCSDGMNTIAQVTAESRKKGLDFICITDHHKYYPSKEAIRMYENVDTGLTIYPGEEVHNCDMGYVHIVNFGGDHSVNELLEADYENLLKKFQKEAEKNTKLDYINAVDFAMRKWICEEIRRGGGKAVFPHPYWTICDEYHSETDFAIYTLNSGIYDIYEIMGGCTVNENQVQAALWHELRLMGNDMPIVASTDAHRNCIIGNYSTIAFVKPNENITDTIMDKRSVAVQAMPGEASRVVGSFRLMKYGVFLMENYFPVYQTYTNSIGELMLIYAKNGSCADALCLANKSAQEYKKSFFGV